ncbi:hypothetical protein K493DRAFT_308615 [Basidiobolus meristosporus CBS 931.73]|uniref:Uncharacterized protein n=1 Tax=Basidiobolus meristosporus CBS 931.73 TaxID=1314790 RepID=A0A1Y1WZS7_9FUNG|nr:hypothetical protein K493DRAFT_308615 [Basidiobolus meristosporus CBS 931.73]|eukprot:ORX78942.1 hypothetical protein K493DRAFT_308615 [Basidiobolus meristosporus CBS 931.73]
MLSLKNLLILTLGTALPVHGQNLTTVSHTYPLQTITWHLATEYISGVISAHTQVATIDAVTFSETLYGDTVTFVDDRYTIARTVEPKTFTRYIPKSTVSASLKLTSISRTLYPSIYTGTDAYYVAVEVETSGIPGSLYTITGPINSGVAVGTVVQKLAERSVIKTIPGPTVTHDVGIGDRMVTTANGVIETEYNITSTLVETFSSTLVTRRIESSSMAWGVTFTVSIPSSGSVSGIQSSRSLWSPPTVTITQDVTASITRTPVSATVGAPHVATDPPQPCQESKGSPIATSSPTDSHANKCLPTTQSKKCHTRPKHTKCLGSQ